MDPTDPLIQKLLEEAEQYVKAMGATPGARELKSRLDQYKRVVQGWSLRAPDKAQRAALRDQLSEIVRIAKANAPTLKIRKHPR